LYQPIPQENVQRERATVQVISPVKPTAPDTTASLYGFHEMRRIWHGIAVADFVLAALLSVGGFLVYVRTLQPDLVGGDAGEFQFVPPILGIPHYTGYPLYVLIGKVWSLLPLGSVAYRMNLLSALFGAMALLCTYGAARVLNLERIPAAVGTGSLGSTWLLWQWATMAGIRAAAVFFAALLLLCVIRWVLHASAAPRSAEAYRAWLLLVCVCGLSLAHHRSTLFWLPALGVAWLMLRPRVHITGSFVLASLLAFVAPLLLYLYLPIRAAFAPPYDQFHPNTWSGFLELVGAVNVSRGLVGVPLAALPSRLSLLLAAFVHEFGPLALALALLGALVLARRTPIICSCTLIFLMELVVQVLQWNIGPAQLNVVYLMPGFVVVALYVAAGCDALIAGTRRALAGRVEWLPLVVIALVGALAIVPVAAAHRAERRILTGTPPGPFRQNLEWGQYPRVLVTSSMPRIESNAVIFTDWEQSVLFNYARLIDGTHPEVRVDWGSGSISADRVRAAVKDGQRPVYVVRPDAGLQGLHLGAVGSLLRASAEPSRMLPVDATPLSISFEDGLNVQGYSLFDDTGRVATQPARLRSEMMLIVYWSARAVPKGDYAISLRLVTADGKQIRQQDNKHPVYGLYPTNTWSTGEIVGDAYEVNLRGIPAGRYSIRTVLYEQVNGTFHNLRQLDAAGQPGMDTATITTFEVLPS